MTLGRGAWRLALGAPGHLAGKPRNRVIYLAGNKNCVIHLIPPHQASEVEKVWKPMLGKLATQQVFHVFIHNGG